MWASSNCSIESVLASAMTIYQEVPSGKLDFTADAVEKVFTILPLVDTTLSMKSCSTSHMFPLHIG
jgi:hypothetical protein